MGEKYTSALRLYNEHRYAQAVEVLTEILDSPGRVTPAERSDSRNSGNSARHHDTGVKSLPTVSESAVMLLMAKALANLGRLPQAKSWAYKAASAQPLDPARYFLVGTIEEALGDLAAAATAMKRVIYLEPKNTSAHFALANLARKQGRPESARRYFENVSALLATMDPDTMVENTDGVTAGRLAVIVSEIRRKDAK